MKSGVGCCEASFHRRRRHTVEVGRFSGSNVTRNSAGFYSVRKGGKGIGGDGDGSGIGGGSGRAASFSAVHTHTSDAKEAGTGRATAMIEVAGTGSLWSWLTCVCRSSLLASSVPWCIVLHGMVCWLLLV